MSGEADLDKYRTDSSGRLAESVPVIDVAGLAGGAGVSGDRSVREIADAARQWGFFQVVNHGIPDTLIDAVWKQAKSFFALPMDS